VDIPREKMVSFFISLKRSGGGGEGEVGERRERKSEIMQELQK
jgi:hypothetical protein